MIVQFGVLIHYYGLKLNLQRILQILLQLNDRSILKDNYFDLTAVTGVLRAQ